MLRAHKKCVSVRKITTCSGFVSFNNIALVLLFKKLKAVIKNWCFKALFKDTPRSCMSRRNNSVYKRRTTIFIKKKKLSCVTSSTLIHFYEYTFRPSVYPYLNVNTKSAKNVMEVSVAITAEDIIKSIRFFDGRTCGANWSALQSENMTPAAMASIAPYQHDTIRHCEHKNA